MWGSGSTDERWVDIISLTLLSNLPLAIQPWSYVVFIPHQSTSLVDNTKPACASLCVQCLLDSAIE